jgi:hypothetical protein
MDSRKKYFRRINAKITGRKGIINKKIARYSNYTGSI